MTWPGLAIAVHVLGVIWWIGGLAFVTLVYIPALRRAELGDHPHALLAPVERRFAPQARIAVALVGASGAYLLYATGLWHVLGRGAWWWLDAMIGYWLIFAVLLFVVEPLGLLERVVFAESEPRIAWRRFHVVHAVLLALAVVVVGTSVAANHGL
ncbi:hypothetical protein [Salinisphaera orenii]|uniref:hypothetical protein n=1 Tax=Salinisphaera orenii TaxID=856731 RepID=UPI000DBEA52E